jgi:hypothetical protein
MAEQIATAILAAIGSATIENSSSSLSYLNRFKVVSTDGETVSEWSTFSLSSQNSISSIITGYTPEYSVTSFQSGGTALNVRWTVPEILDRQKFDIYFAWSYDNGASYTDFEYSDTVNTYTYFIEIPIVSSVLAQYVKVAVQIPTGLKIINTNALLFQTGGLSTRPIFDAGSIV